VIVLQFILSVPLTVSQSAPRHYGSSVQVFCLRRGKEEEEEEEEEVCTSEMQGEKLRNEKQEGVT
jgi:hypothetical protein